MGIDDTRQPGAPDADRLAALESAWYEVVEQVAAGRAAGPCPECQAEALVVEQEGGALRVTCGGCQRCVEMRLDTA